MTSVVRIHHSPPMMPVKKTSGSSSFGRAIAFQAIGGGFEPRLPLKRFGFDPDSYRDRLPLKRFGTALKLAN